MLYMIYCLLSSCLNHGLKPLSDDLCSYFFHFGCQILLEFGYSELFRIFNGLCNHLNLSLFLIDQELDDFSRSTLVSCFFQALNQLRFFEWFCVLDSFIYDVKRLHHAIFNSLRQLFILFSQVDSSLLVILAHRLKSVLGHDHFYKKSIHHFTYYYNFNSRHIYKLSIVLVFDP